MTPDILYLYSFGFSLAVISLTSWAVATIEARMKRDEPSSSTSLIQTGSTANSDFALRPVEIGYMLRGGDTNHAVLVMGVDLLQRAAKLQLGAVIPEPAEYEKKMWSLVKETAKDWAMKKADPYLPPDFKTNPVGFVKKIYDLYQFITKSLKLVVRDIIADPRQLKRYFSMAGVMRLLADFISAGYQNAFATSIRDYLVANNLLVREERRTEASAKIGLVAISIFPAVFIFSLAIVGNSVGIPLMLFAAAVMTGSAIIASFFITAIFAVREFLPYLTEFETLAIVLNRDSWRLRVLQTARKAMMVALTLVALGASVIIFMGAYLWLTVFGIQNANALILVSAFLAFPCLKAFLFLIRSWKIRRTQVATKYGERQLAQTRKRLSEKRPITALTEVLKEEDYNPIFSELMALYGIEALVLLA